MSDAPEYTGQTPPTNLPGGPDDFVEPARWPKPIGITSIVWGSLFFVCGGCGAVGLVMPIVFQQQMMEHQFTDGLVPPVLTAPPIGMWISLGFSLLINLWLIICGIMLVMRKPEARMLHLVYACVGLVNAIAGTWISLNHQAAMLEWCKQNPDSIFAQQQSPDSPVSIAITIVSIVIGFAWPTFCLIWFGMIKRDANEINRGVQAVI